MKLRSGAVEYGRIYEQKIAALFSIKCALDPTISDFWILSNINDFGAFDDIILCINYGDGSKKFFCIQLKHLEIRGLVATSLESKDGGKFSLQKYSETYQNIKKNFKKITTLKGVNMDDIYYVLYTNSPLSGESKLVSIRLEKSDGFDILNTSSSNAANVFKIFNLESSQNPLDVGFTSHFFLYSNQASATFLDKLIKNEFDSHFEDISNTVIITVTDYFLKWAIGKKGKIKKIFKKDVQMKLLELLLLPHIIEPKHSVLKNVSFDLLNDTLTNFNITPVLEKKSLDSIFACINHTVQETCEIELNLETTWNTNLTYEQIDSLVVGKKPNKQLVNGIITEKKSFVAHLAVKDLYLSAWQCKIIPLVVNCDHSLKSIQEIILEFKDVTKDLSFVLFSLHDVTRLKENFKVFNNFNDIDNAVLKDRNLENTFVSLQGKDAIQLKEFKKEVEVLQEITPDVYMILLNDILQVGEACEVENYYIKRSFQRSCLKFDVLHETNVMRERDSNQTGHIFFLVEYAKPNYYLYPYKKNCINFINYLYNCIDNKFNDNEYIITSNFPATDKRLLSIIELTYNERKKSIHVIKLQGAFLEWLFSKGSTEILHDFLIESPQWEDESQRFIQEDNALENFISKINIISNNAGMGKTSMLKSLANKFSPDKWVCFINLSEHMPKISKLNQNRLEYMQHVMDYQISHNETIVRNFCERIYQSQLNSNNVVWLLDGYDEVSSEDTMAFLRHVKTIPNIITWITTRPTYKKELEVAMDTLSLEITHFRQDDHVTFLWKYFETFQDLYGYNEDQIQYIINTINKCASTLDKTFIAIPLQTRMFAQIFGDDINNITEKETLTIVDLHNKFIDIKLKDYKSYEVISLKKTLSKLALKLFFTPEELEDLLDFEELAEEALAFKESYKKDSLVIGLNENGDAVFGHRTFAEFLAAYWLTKEIITRKGNYNTNWKPLIEKLYYVEMIPVRIFFDWILSQNLPLHSAVLNNDIESVQQLLNTVTLKKSSDVLGRTALHIAVTYGKYYDLYLSGKVKGLKNVGLHTTIKETGNNNCNFNIPIINTQLQVQKEITLKLLENGVPNTTDKLFHYDAFDYAMKSCSLDAVNCLYTTFDKDDLLFEPSFNFKVFLVSVIYDNLYHILSKRKTYKFEVPFKRGMFKRSKLRAAFKRHNLGLLKMKYNDQYLTEIAALTGGKETIYELLETDQLTVKDGFPVHKASYNGHSDVVELLSQMGADVKEVDKNGWNPLYQAGRRGRSDITYTFLKESAGKFGSKNKNTHMTPMHYACQGGHLECVKLLIKLGVSATKKDAFEYTPLYYASLYGHIDVLNFLLKNLSPEEVRSQHVQSQLNVAAEKGYSVESLANCGLLNVNNFDEDGNTPLILASKNGFPNVIKELSDASCDLNLMKTESFNDLVRWAQLNKHINFSVKCLHFGIGLKTCGGMAPLHIAILEGHAECVQTLIECGANKDLESTWPVFTYSPIIWAGIVGNNSIIEILLMVKPDSTYSTRTMEDAEIALLWASILGYVECIKVLLSHFPEIVCLKSDRNKDRIEAILKSEYGTVYSPVTRPFGQVNNLPLVLASINNRAHVIKELVTRGYQNNENLNTALYWSSREGHLECVKILVEAGADPNIKNDRFYRLLPIAWASMYGRTNVVKYFLSIRDEGFIKNKDAHLAVNWAAIGGHFDCLKLLLDVCLDVNNADEGLEGNTPLIAACEHRGTVEVIDELLARNCQIAVKNENGLSALDFAAKKKNYEIVKRLINSRAYQDWPITKDTDLYKNLQSVLEWAKAKDEHELLYNLIELGISEECSDT